MSARSALGIIAEQAKPVSNAWNRVRYAVASPFSKAYSAKRRWLREGPAWEAVGIAQADMARKTYVVPRTDAVCITVSKSANTTLKYMLFPPESGEPRRVHNDDHLLRRLTDAGFTLNDLLDGSHRIFTFVRHPVSRFWSAYATKVLHPRPRNAIVAAMAAHFGVPPRPDFPPEMVLDYVRNTPPPEIDEHIRPQWACTAVEKLPMNFIGRVETMRDDILRLRDMGYLDDGHVRRFKHLNPSAARDLPDKARLDADIRAVYAKDMELFGYD